MYTQVKNIKWSNAEHTQIDCEVKFNNLPDEFIPFTANPNDTMEYGVDIFNRCVAGEFGEIGEYVEPIDTRTYAEKRASEYKSIQEQLDMQYWDKVNGTTNWQDHIDEVKAKYPKPID